MGKEELVKNSDDSSAKPLGDATPPEQTAEQKKPKSWAVMAAAPPAAKDVQPAPKQTPSMAPPADAEPSADTPKKPKSWAAMAASASGSKAAAGTPKLGAVSPKRLPKGGPST